MTKKNRQVLEVVSTLKLEAIDKEFMIYGSVDDPLFLAKDVAEWIEHSNTRMMLKSVDEDEKVVSNVYTLGGTQESWFLTEDGVYEILFQSRKPVAKAVKKEVKSVLKTLRKEGVIAWSWWIVLLPEIIAVGIYVVASIVMGFGFMKVHKEINKDFKKFKW